LAACGRKGPPLAPIVYLPRAVTELAVKRVEEDVVIQFKVPATNTDNSAPADLDRVDIYAHTGPLPAAADFVKYGTLVQSVEIKRPEVRKPEDEKKPESKTQDAAPTATKPGGTEKPAAMPAQTPTGVKPFAPELPVAPASPKQSAQDIAEAGPKQPAENIAKADAQDPAKSEPKQESANPDNAGLVEQGWLTSIRETLTPKHRELGPLPPTRAAAAPVTAVVKVETLETPGTENFEMPVARYYTVVGVSRSRHRRGPFAGPIRVPLIDPLQPPDSVDTDYTESAISLKWPGQAGDAPIPPAATGAGAATAQGSPSPAAPGTSPSATVSSQTMPPASAPSTAHEPPAPRDVVAAHLEPAGDPNQETPGTFEIYTDVETAGTQDAPRPGAAPTSKPQPPPVPRFGYNVYDAAVLAQAREVSRPDAQKPANPSKRPAAPPILPLNVRLLTVPAFEDPRVEFGTERCYVVRRVEMAGPVAVESAPSPPACVTPVDKFPPAAPKAVTSVASGTAVSLIWDANGEADLAGYLVLRGEAPGDTLAPLTKSPITDTSYVDTSVRRNRTYVYEVIAVDKTGNQSAVSNRVEEPIR
jgi:hypothetical protein